MQRSTPPAHGLAAPPPPLPLSLSSTTSSTTSTPGALPATRPWHQPHHQQQPQQQQPQSRALGDAHPISLVDSLAASKLLMVENLVDTAALIIESIWPNPVSNAQSKTPVIPLNIFVKETLRRSRTTLSTLQLALYYIHRVRARVLIAREKIHQDQIQSAQQQTPLFLQPGCPPSPCDSVDSRTSDPELVRRDYFNTVSGPLAPRISSLPLTPPDSDPAASLSLSPLSRSSIHASTSPVTTKTEPIECGRRMFLAALILASKFLQDRTYSNKAWSKISGLPVPEINQNEIAFLSLIDYQLFVSPTTFQKWVLILTERGSRRIRPGLLRSNSLPCSGGQSCSSDQVSAKRLKRYSSEIVQDASDAQRFRLSTALPQGLNVKCTPMASCTTGPMDQSYMMGSISCSDSSSRTQRGLGPYMTQCWVQEQQKEYLARSRLSGAPQYAPEYSAPTVADLTHPHSFNAAGLPHKSSTKTIDTLDAMLPSPAASISPIGLQPLAGMKRRLIEVEC